VLEKQKFLKRANEEEKREKARLADEVKRKQIGEDTLRRKEALQQAELRAKRQQDEANRVAAEQKRLAIEATKQADEIERKKTAEAKLWQMKALESQSRAKRQQEDAKREAQRKQLAIKATKKAQKEAAQASEESRRKQLEARKAVQEETQQTLLQKASSSSSIRIKPMTENARQEEAQQKKQEDAVLGALASVASRATIGLFGFGKFQSDVDADMQSIKSEATTRKAPPGAPTLRPWKKNFDGSVTGKISGSRIFQNGEKVTTSAIKSGKFVAGEVVTTGSGSKYFLG
jgi:hypothetical protein